MNQLKRSIVNWRTSSGGLASISAGIAGLVYTFASHELFTKQSLTLDIAMIVIGVSLLFSRDSSVTSEQSGITPSQPSIDESKEVGRNPS